MSHKFSFSLMKSLFNGHVVESALHHYPFFYSDVDGDYPLMAQSISDWVKEHIDSLKLDQEKHIPADLLKGMKEMGLFGLIIPEEFGGSGLTQTQYTRTLELLNTYDTSVSLTVGAHSSIGLKGLYLFGSPAQKAKYMPRLASGDMIASFALTEPTAGSDAAAIKTRAVKQGDYYILNGSKLWITNGGFADFFTVFAKEEINGEDKITAFLVTRDMGGISHGAEEHKLGIKASSTVQVFFKDVKVPVENVLGHSGEGFKIAMSILNQGRVGLAGGAIGAMRSVMNETMQYAKNRKAFDHPIGDFGLIQKMISEMSMEIYASESVTYFTTNLVDSGESDYSIEAAICKVFCTDASWKCINMGMQIHGGNGYMVDYGIERKMRDSRIGLIFEGTNEILRLFIAMSGLKEPASQYQRVSQEIQSMKNLDILNNAISRIGFLSEFALSEVKKTVATEKIEGFHSALEKECHRLASATQALASSASRLIRTYGPKLVDEQMQLFRLADIAIDTYLIACVLSRINSVLEKSGGVEKNAHELAMAKLIIRNAKVRINQNVFDIKENHDKEVEMLSKHVLSFDKFPFSISNQT